MWTDDAQQQLQQARELLARIGRPKKGEEGGGKLNSSSSSSSSLFCVPSCLRCRSWQQSAQTALHGLQLLGSSLCEWQLSSIAWHCIAAARTDAQQQPWSCASFLAARGCEQLSGHYATVW
jgi:uncharacterized protein YyaL (SSP411 family)